MDELTIYIINNYYNLMTLDEVLVRKHFGIGRKIDAANSKSLEATLPESWIIEKRPEVQVLLSKGVEIFLVSVRDRILKDHASDIVFNHCPRCNALARTIAAKQCPKCFYDWHEK